MSTPYTPPEYQKKAFNCPFCNAFSEQAWSTLIQSTIGRGLGPEYICTSLCRHCNQDSIWVNKKIVYPMVTTSPKPNSDMPEEIQIDYNEARLIASTSPRGAAALLRLCIQKLCASLGESGKNIDNDIASLVAKGLPVRIQQALDVVRVVGNEAVHPGTMNLTDDTNTANALFGLVNYIVEDRITKSKEIEALYGALPEAKRNAIEQRDKK